eukprot:3471166-Prymnesium_polylepis.3
MPLAAQQKHLGDVRVRQGLPRFLAHVMSSTEHIFEHDALQLSTQVPSPARSAARLNLIKTRERGLERSQQRKVLPE